MRMGRSGGGDQIAAQDSYESIEGGQMICRQCAKEVEDGSSFCRFCGTATADANARPRPLRRFPSEAKLAGVCAGIADYLHADVTLVRLGWVALSIVPGVLIGGLLAYLLAWLFIPEANPGEHPAYGGKRLVRSTTDRTIGGVCGGIAQYLGVGSTIVRVLWVVLSIYPGALIGGVLAYLIAWAIIPAPQPVFTPASSPA
jgi:phage shock protein C